MAESGSAPHRDDRVLRLVTFQLEDRSYAVPLDKVESVQRMVAVSPVPSAPHWMPGVIDLRGTVVPVVDLRQRLGHSQRPPRLDDRLLIVDLAGRVMALVVDEVREVLEITRRELEDSTDLLPSAVSAVVRRDAGDLLLVVDLDQVVPNDFPRTSQSSES